MGLPAKVKYNFLCFLISILLTGCSTFLQPVQEKELIKTGFAFNTTYTITLSAGGSEDLLEECVAMCQEFEKVFSRTLKGSELYNINEIEKAYLKVSDKLGIDNTLNTKNSKKGNNGNIFTGGENREAAEEEIKALADPGNKAVFHLNNDGSIEFTVSDILYEILEKGLYYSEISEGVFDITIEPESSLWDFISDNRKVPEDKKIKEAVKLTGYKNAFLKDKKLVLKIPGMGIELGAIAKGFIADKLKEHLKENGVTSGTVNLGGNVLCIGKKTDGSPFRIGIQHPFENRNEVITAVKAEDISVVSSGVYERYFMQDGKMYHHILDPSTGYPYNNGLVAITVISGKSVDGDALSTTCFAMGLEKGMEFANSLDSVYALFITEDGKLHYSEGFKEMETGN